MTVDASALSGVREIVVITDLNPIQKVLSYQPTQAKPYIAFRFKAEQGTPVRAAVLTEDGVWHLGGVYVDAAGGGCTAPALAHGKPDWVSRLAEVRAKVWRKPGQSSAKLRLRIQHPMDTGLADGIPAFYVESLEVQGRDGTTLGKLQIFEPVSENPVLTLKPQLGPGGRPRDREGPRHRRQSDRGGGPGEYPGERAGYQDLPNPLMRINAACTKADSISPMPMTRDAEWAQFTCAMASRRAFLKAGLAGAAVAALPAPVFAATLDYALEATQIAPDTYAVYGAQEQFSLANGGNIVNTAFVVTDEGVVVIDTGPSLRYGEALKELIQKVAKRDVVRVYITHHHPDHMLGNQAFEPSKLASTETVIANIKSEGDMFAGNMYRLVGDWMRGTEVRAPGNRAHHQSRAVRRPRVRAHPARRPHQLGFGDTG